MKKLMTVVLFFQLLFAGTIFSQTEYLDVIYLKNGSIIRGTIVEQIPNVSIKISTFDGNVFVYPIEEIEKFTKESISHNENRKKNGLEKGYRGILELEYIHGIYFRGMTGIGLSLVNGFQINNFIYMGLRTGIQNYMDRQIVLVPVNLDTRFYFSKNRVTPYFSLSPGYSIEATGKTYAFGALTFNTALGANINFNGKTCLTISFGYQLISLIEQYGYQPVNGLTARLGLSF